MSVEFITVQEDQSIFDLGVKYYGSEDGAYIFIADNPGLCDLENVDPVPGTQLSYDSSKIINRDVVEEFIVKEISPANAVGKGGFDSGFNQGFDI